MPRTDSTAANGRRHHGGDAALESIVSAYTVWQNGLGWHAVIRDLAPELHADTRDEMRTKLVAIGKFAGQRREG